MRTYGRIQVGYNPDQTPHYEWKVIQTAADGSNDLVYVTTLAQVLKLNLNESPFYANYGIPAKQSVLTQIFPDYYVYVTQQQFAPFFASLLITRVPQVTTPTYNVNVLTHQGTRLNYNVPIPT